MQGVTTRGYARMKWNEREPFIYKPLAGYRKIIYSACKTPLNNV